MEEWNSRESNYPYLGIRVEILHMVTLVVTSSAVVRHGLE